jgi:DNA processing protein
MADGVPFTALSPDQQRALQLWLVPGVGPRLWQLLINAFGDASAVLAASDASLQQVNGVGPKLAKAIRSSSAASAEDEWHRCQAAGVNLCWLETADYPAALARIPDPPPLLMRKGTYTPADELAIAIVGSRHATPYGLQTAEKLAAGLARHGITVVSGLARGIDAAAHRGALEAGGRTLAVLATGLACLYPPEHGDLAEEVAGQGMLLTESPLLQAPVPGLFPQRNRIIAGLSLGVIVVEASRKSGALHTVRHAIEQNRDVFAVPGRIDSAASAGCLDLLKDGAILIRGVDDVLSALGPLTVPVRGRDDRQPDVVHHPAELQLSDQERAILNLASLDPTPIDDIIRQSGLEASRVLTTLTVLEMRRLLRRLPGGFVVRGTGIG